MMTGLETVVRSSCRESADAGNSRAVDRCCVERVDGVEDGEGTEDGIIIKAERRKVENAWRGSRWTW